MKRMKLADMTVTGFAAEVASDSPAPGGGSVSALAGAIGAALTAVVSGLTVGRKKYAGVQELVTAAQAQSNTLREKFLDVMDRDTAAFLDVSAAYAMPKQTEEEKAARTAAIQAGLKGCTKTPFEMMQLCAESLELLSGLAGKTNVTAASDFGVAALSLKTAMQGAWLNVLINIGSITDETFAEHYRKEGETLLAACLPAADRCFEHMRALCENG